MEMIISGTVGQDCNVTKYVSVNYEAIRNREKPGTTIEYELIKLVNYNFNGFDRINSIIVAVNSGVISSAKDINCLDVNEVSVVAERISSAIYRECGPRQKDLECEKVLQELISNGCSLEGMIDYLVEKGYDKWFADMWVDVATLGV